MLVVLGIVSNPVVSSTGLVTDPGSVKDIGVAVVAAGAAAVVVPVEIMDVFAAAVGCGWTCRLGWVWIWPWLAETAGIEGGTGVLLCAAVPVVREELAWFASARGVEFVGRAQCTWE